MPQRFVSKRKVKLDAADESMQLIWGDAVETVGSAGGGEVMVRYRGREGTVAVDALDGEARLECYFLDVGQGDATLIVTPGRRKILIDGGKGVAAGRTGEAEQALIWKYRLDEVDDPVVIDLVVLTHADEDHIGGLINLIKNPKIVVKRVVHSGIATFRDADPDRQLGATTTKAGVKYLVSHHDTVDDLERDDLSDDFAAWVAVLELEGVDYHSVQAGDTLDVGDPDIEIEVVGPVLDQLTNPDRVALRWLGDKSHTINGHSVVLRLTYQDVAVLLAGDINIEGADHLLAAVGAAGLDAHVLKAPHHGSHEFTPEFLAAVNPQITTISSGEIPDHGHPRPDFLAAAGRHSRGDRPLLYSTALSAVFGRAQLQDHQDSVDANADGTPADNAATRDLFRKLLPGIINVRSDGQHIFAATRVQTGYWWVIYGPEDPAPRTTPTP